MNSFVYIVIYRYQLDVAPLQNLFLLAVLKLDRKDSFGYSKEIVGKNLPYNMNLLYKHCLAYILLI